MGPAGVETETDLLAAEEADPRPVVVHEIVLVADEEIEHVLQVGIGGLAEGAGVDDPRAGRDERDDLAPVLHEEVVGVAEARREQIETHLLALDDVALHGRIRWSGRSHVVHRLVHVKGALGRGPAEAELDHLLPGEVIAEAKGEGRAVVDVRGHRADVLFVGGRRKNPGRRPVPEVRRPERDVADLGHHLPGLVPVLRPDRSVKSHGGRAQQNPTPDDRQTSHRSLAQRAARALSTRSPFR